MPKQKSIFKLSGKIDDVSFYQRNGVHLARKASGPSREQILTSPRFQRTRENISEFAALSVAAGSFTKAISKVSALKDGTLRNRLMKVFRVINKSSGGIRGQRPVMVSLFKQHLLKVELNAATSFEQWFKGIYEASHDPARNKATITLPAFNIPEGIVAPPSATHFRFVQLLGVMANTVYNVDQKKYEPVDGVLNGISEITYSDYQSLSSNVPVNVQLLTSLADGVVLSDQVAVIQGLGIIFTEMIDGIHYPLKQGSAMKLVDVF